MPGSKGSRYVYAPKHVKTILEKIQTTGRPDKVNSSYIMKVWLLKNAQYAAILDILKDMEFIDNSGKPLELYKKYQNTPIAKIALANGIKNAYHDLFKAYPGADSLPKADLRGYVAQQTGKTGKTLERIVSTFYALCGLADFSSAKVEAEKPKAKTEDSREREIEPKISLEPNIQVNIGINIASDTPNDKIELIFKNMRKYLLQKPNGEANK